MEGLEKGFNQVKSLAIYLLTMIQFTSILVTNIGYHEIQYC